MHRALTINLVGALLVGGLGLACGPGGAAPSSNSAVPTGGAEAANAPANAGAGATSGQAASSVGTSSSPASAADAAPPALRSLELPIASTNATMTPFWVAVEQGLWRQHGLDVQVVYLPPSTASQALSSGTVPVAATGGSTVTAYVGGSTELVYIGGVSNKAPYRVVARPEIARLEDLRGKAVGLASAGASPSVAMGEVLRRIGMEPDRDVNFVYMRDTSASIAGLLSNAVQATATGSPQAEYALAEGMRLLLDMRELNIPILGINVSTTRGTLEREPDLLRRVLMGYIEGLQYARDNPDVAIPALMRGSRVDDRDLAELAYKEYTHVWDPWPSEAGIQTLLDSMTDVPAAKTVRPAEMIDERILRDLERSGWLAQHYRAQ